MSYKSTLYSQYFGGLKTAINSLYGTTVTKKIKSTKDMPIVEMLHLSYGLQDETMSRTDGQYNVAYEINLFAQNKVVNDVEVLGEVMVEQLEELVINYFHANGFRVNTPKVVNSDVNVSRRMIRVSGIYNSMRDIMYRD